MNACSTTVVAAALLATISGCESSQETSARLQRQGAKALAQQHGLVITATNRDVRVIETAVLTDKNGTAAVVVMRNRTATPLGTLPIAIDVLGPANRSVFRNNDPGLQPALVSVASLPARAELAWVNDQVVPTGPALRVNAEVGAGVAGAPPTLPRIDIGPAHLVNDPISGLEADGTIRNSSTVTQLKLFVYCVALRGGRVVAAGRGAIARLARGARTTYHVFLIGNPQGAQFSVSAPPPRARSLNSVRPAARRWRPSSTTA